MIQQCAAAGAGRALVADRAGTSIVSATPCCLLGTSVGLSHKRSLSARPGALIGGGQIPILAVVARTNAERTLPGGTHSGLTWGRSRLD